MNSPVARVAAPAKLTLELHVTGVRSDGYHLIDAEMVTLDTGDTLEIRSAPDTLVEILGPAGEAVDAGPDNLVVRALELAGRTAHVRLEKHIPPGAGLGGGSADAAAVLRWAGWDDPIGAASIGADVAFCLVGGRARVSGIGEVVEPLPVRPEPITLLTPNIVVSTPAVYRVWDEMGGPTHPVNDLTEAALAVVPELADWRNRLADASGQEPVLAGSGGTWFVRGTYPDIEMHGVRSVTTMTASGYLLRR
jgi:4-diphosphocytidyl-2-C-methyl-D-erythritol kinase